MCVIVFIFCVDFVRCLKSNISPLAQLVERETVNLEAVGSTPTWRV